jgi:NADH dehydrogenase (ubiquinone) 1 alpha subcomplex subunit 9
MNPSFKTLTKPFYRAFSSRLQIFDQGGRHSVSGIRATIFGATGFMGPYIGSAIGYIGSDLIFPHDHRFLYDDEVKELKLCAGTGQSYLVRDMDFDDLKMIDRVIANSNVVINLLGPRKKVKNIKEFEYINRTVPRRIAQACARNPNVIRYLQFSAVGADVKSQSMDFRTKALGEQDVMEAFPNTTIIRPTTVYGPNDYFMRLWLAQKNFFYNFNVVFDDCKAKRQPIFVTDVAMATLNALKMHETCGKTYELGILIYFIRLL